MYHGMWYIMCMPKIIPLRELKNASNISKMCHENNEPIFVTKNGESDLVIMTSKQYDSISGNYNLNIKDSYVNDNLFNYVKDRDSKPLYTIAEIKKVLTPIFDKHKVKKAILFGSYVKGTADTRSDIDLVVETNLSGMDFYGLLGEVSDKLRFPVDLIERKEIKKNSKFEKEVKETGVTIYG